MLAFDNTQSHEVATNTNFRAEITTRFAERVAIDQMFGQETDKHI